LTSYLLYVLVVTAFLYHTLERYRRFEKARSLIRWRVHVNGIRGKSTTTRYIAAVFREQGYRTFGKTTGSAARILLPDGSESSIQRKGMANINEQVKILRQFSNEGAEAAVMECMAVNPVYGEWLEQKVMQSRIGVLTNIRLDHTDYLGETLEEIARALAKSIPRDGILITAEQDPKLQAILKQSAQERGTQVVIVDGRSIEPNSLRGFNHFAIEDNVAIGYAVADRIGLPRHRALRAMQAAKPDPGALCLTTLKLKTKTIHWANLFAVNDRESFVILCERIFKMHPESQRLVILNNRHDRQSRVELFTRLSLQLQFEIMITFGDYEKEVSQITSSTSCRVVHCGNSSALRQANGSTLLETIEHLIDQHGSAVLIGAVNIHTPQAYRLMDAISNQQEWS
jgi:poly-gamma-glutamate synthase PgsB/CapB